MVEKRPLSPDEIAEIVRGIAPPDWPQIELLGKMPPGQRFAYMVERSEQKRLETKEWMRPQYPELNERELNLKVLEYLTGDKIPEGSWALCKIEIPPEQMDK